MFLHSSGGLVYHVRALRWRHTLWSPFHAVVKSWLMDWQPDAAHLVLVGPSGGYALNADFLARFSRITVLEPDALARFILKGRFPECRFERGNSDGLPDQDGFIRLAQRYPDAALLFCNLLGQHLVGERADVERQIWLSRLMPALLGRAWASWHDLASTETPPAQFTVLHLPKAEPLEQVLAHYWPRDELDIYDHDCTGIWPEHLRQYAIWQLKPNGYHLVEWLHSNERNMNRSI